jgi:hypothetical protein
MEVTAQINLGKMSEKDRNEYLINLSREVAKNFGPGYNTNLQPTIELMKYKVVKFEDGRRTYDEHLEGCEYYRVTFPYDETKERLDWSYSAFVEILKDTGEPICVMFGIGWGKNFVVGLSYKEWLKVGIEKENQVVYQQAVRDTIDIWGGKPMWYNPDK